MNQITLSGNVVKKPELRYTQNNISTCLLTICVKRPNTKDKIDFLDIELWRTNAENSSKYLDKGAKVLITGIVTKEKYEKDGKTNYITKIIGNSVEFLSYSKDSQNKKDIETNEEVVDDPFADFGQEVQLSDEDLPF